MIEGDIVLLYQGCGAREVDCKIFEDWTTVQNSALAVGQCCRVKITTGTPMSGYCAS